ncbi:MAG: hypothetical protein ACOH2I_08190 [Pseudomonas sp.]
MDEGVEQVFRNVERTLKTAGAGWEHVIHVNAYHIGGIPKEVSETMTRLCRRYMLRYAPIWTPNRRRRARIADDAHRDPVTAVIG